MQIAARAWKVTAAALLLAGAVHAQELRSHRMDRADWAAQMTASSLHAALRGRHVHDDGGRQVGRVWDVSVAEDRMTPIAIIALRRRLGGGRIAIPVALLRQVGTDLIIDGPYSARQVVRSMPRL
jgi:sporulation protein YlmC with PRC-barrel domain